MRERQKKPKESSLNPSPALWISRLKERMPQKWAALNEQFKKSEEDGGLGIDLDVVLKESPDSTLEGDELACALTIIDEQINTYEASLVEGLEDTPIPAPSEAIPLMMYNYGFDIWWDGNRGTKYQRDVDPDVVTDYWDFDMTTMGINDQPAQIEYILQKTGAEKLSYIGYSMGTMQMYALLGHAAEYAALQKTVDKVDKFLSITPCAWSSTELKLGPGATLEERRAAAVKDAKKVRDLGVRYILGEGSDKEASKALFMEGIENMSEE